MHCDATGDAPHRLLALVELGATCGSCAATSMRAEALCDSVLLEATDGGRPTRARRDVQAPGRHRARARRLRRAPSATSPRRTTTRCAARICCSPAETSREQAELFELMGKNRETLQALTQSHQSVHQARVAAQPRRAAGARRPPRGRASTTLVARWAGIDRIEGRVHARPLRARRRLRVRAGARRRLRRDDDVLVPHRRAAARRRQDRRCRRRS